MKAIRCVLYLLTSIMDLTSGIMELRYRVRTLSNKSAVLYRDHIEYSPLDFISTLKPFKLEH